QDPTPARIRELVDRLVNQKIVDGQLDQSPLTLREIDLIKESLVNVLTGMYHHRIDYPSAPSPPPDSSADPMVAEPSVSHRWMTELSVEVHQEDGLSLPVDPRRVEAAVRWALEREGARRAEISVAFLGDDGIAELN